MIFNAVINSTMLGFEDRGILTFFLYIEWDRSGQGFGGYALDSQFTQHLSISCIKKILETVGVDQWENLPGKQVRIEIKSFNAEIESIGHITEDKWFNPSDHFKQTE
jgi:hypothetical protein